jgi:hypothetical protein
VAFSCVVANAVMLMLDEEVKVIESLLWETLAPVSGARMSAVASLMEIVPDGKPVVAALELEVVVAVLLEAVPLLDCVVALVSVLAPPPPKE